MSRATSSSGGSVPANSPPENFARLTPTTITTAAIPSPPVGSRITSPHNPRGGRRGPPGDKPTTPGPPPAPSGPNHTRAPQPPPPPNPHPPPHPPRRSQAPPNPAGDRPTLSPPRAARQQRRQPLQPRL